MILTSPGSFLFGLVRNRSDFDSSGSVNRKRVYGSVCNQSEPTSWALVANKNILPVDNLIHDTKQKFLLFYGR